MFKEVTVDGNWSSKLIETALRRHTARRHHSLQLISSVYPNMNDKYFVGYETEKEIDFCRIRTSYERVLPKLIIRFNKADFTRYTLHPAITYIIGYLFLGVLLTAGFLTNLFSGMFFDAFFFLLLLLGLYGLVKLELKLITKRINFTLRKFTETFQS